MKRFAKHIGLLLFVLMLGCKSKTVTLENSATAEKPNILIIHVDDLGYHDLSMNGSKIYQTSNIDALAKESVVFTNAYSNYPRCVPSRFAMMTGNYPIQNGTVLDDGFKMNSVSDDKNFIKNKGIKITKIVNDSIGLFYGLHPDKDILGNTINSLPDLGAIELK